MAKVLGIAASPRKNGNSDLLLDRFLEGAVSSGHDIEKIYICDKDITPCDEKNVCFRTGICRIRDDMQELYGKLLAADCLVVSAPVFFMGPPAQLKAMIDRCQALWAKRFILKRPLRQDDKKRYAVLLGAAGLNRKGSFTGVKETMKAFFYVLGFKYKGDILVEGVDDKGDILKRKNALEEAYRLGKGIMA